MDKGVICGVVTPHTPRMGIEAKAPDFVRGVIAGSRELGRALLDMKPDAIVLASSHWVATFNWYATCQPVHQGVCVADEAPDLIPGIPYKHPGHPALAAAIIDTAKKTGAPIFANDSPHFTWDYGSLVPLQYLDPEARIPIVLLPTCISADLDECERVGSSVHEAAAALGLRVILAASCSFSHKLVRGPDVWPSDERIERDRQFIGLLTKGAIDAAVRDLPDYVKFSVVEVGGRNIATVLGGLAGRKEKWHGRQFGPYGQSSASGNTSVAVWAR
jgi:3,4-dihydroxyphenylacetate 2,3-dioxygenase